MQGNLNSKILFLSAAFASFSFTSRTNSQEFFETTNEKFFTDSSFPQPCQITEIDLVRMRICENHLTLLEHKFSSMQVVSLDLEGTAKMFQRERYEAIERVFTAMEKECEKIVAALMHDFGQLSLVAQNKFIESSLTEPQSVTEKLIQQATAVKNPSEHYRHKLRLEFLGEVESILKEVNRNELEKEFKGQRESKEDEEATKRKLSKQNEDAWTRRITY